MTINRFLFLTACIASSTTRRLVRREVNFQVSSSFLPLSSVVSSATETYLQLWEATKDSSNSPWGRILYNPDQEYERFLIFDTRVFVRKYIAFVGNVIIKVM